jgi:hypothetical protein
MTTSQHGRVAARDDRTVAEVRTPLGTLTNLRGLPALGLFRALGPLRRGQTGPAAGPGCRRRRSALC